MVNVGDEYGRRLAAELPDAITFEPTADALGELETLKLRGRFNVENALACGSGRARARGRRGGDPARASRRSTRVPGRFEAVDEGQPFTVFVDYAHTPGALETALDAAREFARGPRDLRLRRRR